MSADSTKTPANAPKVLTKEEAKTAAPSGAAAMAAGDARREEMKREKDALAKHAAEFEAKWGGDIGAIDPAKLDVKNVDNEIAQYTDNPSRDGSIITGARSDRRYFWAEAVGRHGQEVQEMKSIGWKVVGSGDSEEKRRMAPDGTRRWGTAILMWIEATRAEALKASERRRTLARTSGMSEQLLIQAERAGIKIHDLEDPKTPDWIKQGAHAQAQAAAANAAAAAYASAQRQFNPRGGRQRVLASELANRKLNDAIRNGTIPGITPGT